MAPGTTSNVWRHFEEKEGDESKAVCKINKCTSREVSRGGNEKKKFTTSPLWAHLKRHHRKEHDELKNEQKENEEKKAETLKRKQSIYKLLDDASPAPPLKTAKIDCYLEKPPYSDGDPAQKRHEYKCAHWLCTAMQPYTAVENAEFKEMINDLDSRINCRTEKHYRVTIIPDIYNRLLGKIKAIIFDTENVCHICLTTDFWSSEPGDGYMALTSHYINSNWNRKMAVLDCIPFNESHTSQNIAEAMRTIFLDWNLQERCHLVVRDNATNLVKALDTNHIDSFGCFLHTLHLVVTHSILAFKSVSELLDRAQKLTIYFKNKAPKEIVPRRLLRLFLWSIIGLHVVFMSDC